MSVKELIDREPIIWEVHGLNWTADVYLNPDEDMFTRELQAYTAASKSIQSFEGLDNEVTINLDQGAKVPSIGSVLFANIKGDGDQKNRVILFTHIVYANCSLWKKSVQFHQIYQKKMNEAAAKARDDKS